VHEAFAGAGIAAASVPRRPSGGPPWYAVCRGIASILAALVCACSLASAQTAEATIESVRARVASLLARVPQSDAVALLVVDADTGQVWFAHQVDTPLKPASVQKLFTTAAALERLGPGFAYETRLYLRGNDLWVIGAGDPAIGDERLARRYGKDVTAVFDEWAAALRSRGVTSVGDLVLDDTIFDQRWTHPDWPDSQAEAWYQAPVGGLNVNDNCLDVRLIVRAGRVEVTSQPALPPEALRSAARVAKQHRPILRRRPAGDGFELSGTVSRSATLRPLAVRQPTIFFGQALRQALEQRGIRVTGSVVRRELAALVGPEVPLARCTTSLVDVLWRANTHSQNLFAECLIKSLVAYERDGRRSGVVGNWDGGRAVMLETLRTLGVDMTGATIRDGSGLSHQNRVTARQVVTLLTVMRRHRHGDVFVSSLAAAGEPGSMQHRFADPALRGRLRGKTGSLDGVRSLAGYLHRPDGCVLAFALLANTDGAADLPVDICRALVETN